MTHPGTDVMIFEIFSPKKIAKKLAFLTQNKHKLCKILIMIFKKFLPKNSAKKFGVFDSKQS
jgi:hypothetical protein